MVHVIGHRGASADARENTLEAFRLARVQGADWVELDVRWDGSNLLRVHHDAELPDGRPVDSVTDAEMPPDVPTLADALLAAEGMGVNIEIKTESAEPGYEGGQRVVEAVVETAVSLRDRSTLLVSSFDTDIMSLLRTLDPAMPTALLWYLPADTERLLDRAVAEGHRAVHPWDAICDRGLVERARTAGLDVNVWTVNDPGRMAELVEWGVTGLVTDVPSVAREVCDELGRDPAS